MERRREPPQSIRQEHSHEQQELPSKPFSEGFNLPIVHGNRPQGWGVGKAWRIRCAYCQDWQDEQEQGWIDPHAVQTTQDKTKQYRDRSGPHRRDDSRLGHSRWRDPNVHRLLNKAQRGQIARRQPEGSEYRGEEQTRATQGASAGCQSIHVRQHAQPQASLRPSFACPGEDPRDNAERRRQSHSADNLNLQPRPKFPKRPSPSKV